ncbi:MAG: MBL fold metallo-hydrolase [Candidatus Tectomicrobia bacterium]
MKVSAQFLFVALGLSGANALAQEVITTNSHRLTEVIDNVYLAQSTAPLFNSNALVLVNAEDVIVIDSHITPQKGRELIASIKKLTSKPITTLINSHFHYDHSHGNQVFGPDVEIIGHEYTRMKMAGAPLAEKTFVGGRSRNIEALQRLAAELKAESKAEPRAELQIRYDLLAEHVKAWEEIAPVAPNVTLHKRMTLFRGEREIQLLFLGRAHTGGDISVYLPKEGLIFTGDMMLAGPSWLGDGYVDEWDETLENLKQLEFEIIVPGHGEPFRQREKIAYVQAFYRDLWAKTESLHNDGASVEQAAQQIDMTNHADTLGVTRVGFDPSAIARMYARMNGAD